MSVAVAVVGALLGVSLYAHDVSAVRPPRVQVVRTSELIGYRGALVFIDDQWNKSVSVERIHPSCECVRIRGVSGGAAEDRAVVVIGEDASGPVAAHAYVRISFSVDGHRVESSYDLW